MNIYKKWKEAAQQAKPEAEEEEEAEDINEREPEEEVEEVEVPEPEPRPVPQELGLTIRKPGIKPKPIVEAKYNIQQVTTQSAPVIFDKKNQPMSEQQILVELMNKMDRIEKAVCE